MRVCDVIVVTADRRVYVLKDDSEVTVDVTNLLDVSDTAKSDVQVRPSDMACPSFRVRHTPRVERETCAGFEENTRLSQYS